MSATQIGTIVERLQRSANVESVYGDPIVKGEKTVVPVARVAFGFGGGYGTGSDSEDESGGRGGGVGGGASATPLGRSNSPTTARGSSDSGGAGGRSRGWSSVWPSACWSGGARTRRSEVRKPGARKSANPHSGNHEPTIGFCRRGR